jgi:hypothetical protein
MGRKKPLNDRRIVTPVHKRQPFPPLPHDRPVHRERARSRLAGGDHIWLFHESIMSQG